MTNRDLGAILIIWGAISFLNWVIADGTIAFVSLFPGYYLSKWVIKASANQEID